MRGAPSSSAHRAVVSLHVYARLSYATGLLKKCQNPGGFAPASCCMGVQVYVSMWSAEADPLMRRCGTGKWQCRARFTGSDRRAIWLNSTPWHFAM